MRSNDKSNDNWRHFLRHPIIISIIVAMLGLPFLKPLVTRIPSAPEVISHLPEFRLITERKEAFSLENLRGHVTIAAFVFTRCRSICPVTIAAMRELQERFHQVKLPIRLLGISVDPEYDTPEVLTAFRDEKKLDPDRWTFLTGEKSHVQAFIESGFQVPMGDREEHAGGHFDISHSRKMVLIDNKGAIRGFFDTTVDGIDEVFHRSQHVLFSLAQK